MRWGTERRLEFIEFRLFWEGGLNRADITDFFGVSVPQASKDLSQYRELAPANIHYDLSAKRYLAAPDFRPIFLKPDADRYLNQLRSIADRVVPADETWLASVPEAEAMPVPHRQVDVTVLRMTLAAIRERASVEILYQSMNEQRPEPIWRHMSPHAFGSDGFRWHVRAFCHIDNKFKDFLLSRCLDARSLGKQGAVAEDDLQWRETFNVILSPNPMIGENQRKVIAQDYGMHEGTVVIPVRQALLYYFRKRLRLDVADVLDDPRETPVVVTNRAEFDAALVEAMK